MNLVNLLGNRCFVSVISLILKLHLISATGFTGSTGHTGETETNVNLGNFTYLKVTLTKPAGHGRDNFPRQYCLIIYKNVIKKTHI